MSSKRGPYFKYKIKQNKLNVPRQTIWSRRQKHKLILKQNQINVQQLFFDPETVCNDVNVECTENENIDDFEEDFNHDEENIIDESDGSDCGEHFKTNDFDFDEFELLKNNPNCTKTDAMLIIYAFAIRHNLNWKAIEDLVHLVNTLQGFEVMPASKYFFKKKFGEKDLKRTTHFLCHACDKYLGTEEKLKSENIKTCQNCETEICMDTKYKKNHFITIPVEIQIKNLLEQNEDHINLNSAGSTDSMRDIQDSLNYRRLMESSKDDKFITLTVSTDGAVVYRSTKEKSLWPIQFFINEISLKYRFKRKNMICAAFSFGKTPDMATFFKCFIEELNKINTDGGITFRMKSGELCKVKVFLFLVTADAPAKSDILNKVHHSGRGGCPYCEHNGTVLPGKTQVLYCNRDCARLRDNETTRASMMEAHFSGKRVNGYHGLSPLLALDYAFDMVLQIVIDQMHFMDIGVIKRLLNLFLESKYRKQK